MERIALAFAVAFLLSLLLTPYVRKLALRLGAVDKPDARRIHLKPTIGGLALYTAFLVAVLVTVPMERRLIGIVVGATIVLITGFIDDIRPLPAKIKLFPQIGAALFLVYFGGYRIQFLTNPLGRALNGHLDFLQNLGIQVSDFIYLSSQFTTIAITVIWIVGITNAINLIDGLDGLAAGVSGIASLTLMVVALTTGQWPVTVLTAALAGSTLGFLRWNFNPARIFMGDTGALFLGFVLASVALEGFLKSATVIALAVPVLVFGLPIMDTVFVILRRAFGGRPITSPDRGHLHHHLMDRGLSHRKAVLVLYLISGCFSLSAVVLSRFNAAVASLVILALGIALFVWARRFGLWQVLRQERNLNL
ncbi:MAG: undecaprenyl/decaprenyl-phosphate alpha-N-acetylglucosaminyl 1-phosphate transferase [Firmicutes bacterium]|nr:undecaprenyl/decaprenyl-phosphate alpha-N-acetylglucosaminyl 1-phosphate transferase [Bacillota bacterium]